MREVISVHVGQAGVQIGNACCELSPLSGLKTQALHATGFVLVSLVQDELTIFCRGALHRRARPQREYFGKS